MNNVINSFDGLTLLLPSNQIVQKSKPITKTKIKPIKKDKSFENLNSRQKEIYLELTLGLKMYSQKELNLLHEYKIKKIKINFSKTKRFLNIWKQKLIINYSTFLLEKSNANPALIKLFNDHSKPSTYFNCDLLFEELNVTQTDIIKALIQNGLLPNNFKTL